MIKWNAMLMAGLLSSATSLAFAATAPTDSPEAKVEAQRLNNLPPVPPAPPGHIDHSGRKEKGRASFYANSFAHGRWRMANG